MLRDAGYRTALIGKWHLGYPPHFGPLRSGYEEFFGPGCRAAWTTSPIAAAPGATCTSARARQEGYLTDPDLARSVDYVRRMAGRARGHAVLSEHALHGAALAVGDADDAAHRRRRARQPLPPDGGNIDTYRRMIHPWTKASAGWWRALRDELELLDDTLIVFTSDNGGERFSDNWPLVGGKMDLTEGGIRVPWIAHWPAVIAAGGMTDQGQCMTMDWSATMLALGGATPPPTVPLDGVSLTDVLRDPQAPLPAPALLAHEAPRPARAARGRLEIPARRRSRLPVRPEPGRTRTRQPRQTRAGPPRRHAHAVGGVGTQPCRSSRGRDGEPGLYYADMPQTLGDKPSMWAMSSPHW